VGTTVLKREEWMAVHFLSGNLASRSVSRNLVSQLRNYLACHPDSEPDEYLARLVRLGDAFAGGEDELRQRRELRQTVCTLAGSVPDLDWPLVLSWTARLIVAYRPERWGRSDEEQERQIKARIQKELKQVLKQLEEPYYG
jgi:hypothetical protein